MHRHEGQWKYAQISGFAQQQTVGETAGLTAALLARRELWGGYMTRTPRSVLVNLWHKSFLWKSDNLYAEPNRQAWEKMFTCCLSFLTKYMLLVFQQQAALLCQFIVKWKHLSIVCRSAVDAKINSKRKWPPLLLICDRFFLTLQWTPTLAKCVKT